MQIKVHHDEPLFVYRLLLQQEYTYFCTYNYEKSIPKDTNCKEYAHR